MQLKHQADLSEAVVNIKYASRPYENITLKDVAEKIRTITDEIAPGKKINSDDTIDLQITSKYVPDLTLIDLPGIAYSDDTGGGREVADRVKNLWTKYIEDEGCVILCVVPANADVGTQEAYTIAREVDPTGKRTIGVVTKMDTIEEADGPTIVARLSGEGQNAWKFAMGCHAIRNRNQTEITNKITRDEVDAEEDKFFSTHKELFRMPQDQRASILGFPSLVKDLTGVQSRMIRDGLPRVKKDIRTLLEAKRRELNALPPNVASEVQAQNALRKLTADLRGCIDKLYRVEYDDLPDFGGAKCPPGLQDTHRLNNDETRGFPKWLEMMPCLQRLLDEFEEAIRRGGQHIMTSTFAETAKTELDRLQGFVLPDLITHSAVKTLSSVEVTAFEEPARKMLDSVYDYFSEVLAVLVTTYFSNYPRLRDHVQGVVGDLLNESLVLCNERLVEQIEIEQRDVYTLNHYYSDTVHKVMTRIDEVVIGTNEEYTDYALQAISKDQPASSSVTIAGVSGGFAVINGTYVPSDEVYGGELVYKSNQGNNCWLEFDATEKYWRVCEMSERTNRSDFEDLAHGGTMLPFGVSKGWKTFDGKCWVAQPQISANRAAIYQTTTFAQHNNFERAVKDTQIRLWCYRKVVHKCFCDTMAKFVRFHFPRKLKDHLEEKIHQSLMTEEDQPDTTDEGHNVHQHGKRSLQDMMSETTDLADKRQRLTTSIAKLVLAKDVMAHL